MLVNNLSTNGLVNILYSSEHKLKDLNLSGVHLDGQYPYEGSWDNPPVLAKLATFSSHTGSEFWPGTLFRGRHSHMFPPLKKLILCTTDKGVVNGFTDGLFVVPSVTRIDF